MGEKEGRKGKMKMGGGLPRVVPALCIEYLIPDFASKRCTSATSAETLAVGVPIGMRQKSTIQEYIVSVFGCYGFGVTLGNGKIG